MTPQELINYLGEFNNSHNEEPVIESESAEDLISQC